MIRSATRFSWGRGAILGFFVVCAGLPIAGSLAYAGSYSIGLAGLLSHGLTLGYWRQALADRKVGAAFATSGYVAVTVALLTVGLALTLALTLGESLRHGPLATLIYFPLALPSTVRRCAPSSG